MHSTRGAPASMGILSCMLIWQQDSSDALVVANDVCTSSSKAGLPDASHGQHADRGCSSTDTAVHAPPLDGARNDDSLCLNCICCALLFGCVVCLHSNRCPCTQLVMTPTRKQLHPTQAVACCCYRLGLLWPRFVLACVTAGAAALSW